MGLVLESSKWFSSVSKKSTLCIVIKGVKHRSQRIILEGNKGTWTKDGRRTMNQINRE